VLGADFTFHTFSAGRRHSRGGCATQVSRVKLTHYRSSHYNLRISSETTIPNSHGDTCVWHLRANTFGATFLGNYLNGTESCLTAHFRIRQRVLGAESVLLTLRARKNSRMTGRMVHHAVVHEYRCVQDHVNSSLCRIHCAQHDVRISWPVAREHSSASPESVSYDGLR
jgi:hypothetical protein